MNPSAQSPVLVSGRLCALSVSTLGHVRCPPRVYIRHSLSGLCLHPTTPSGHWGLRCRANTASGAGWTLNPSICLPQNACIFKMVYKTSVKIDAIVSLKTFYTWNIFTIDLKWLPLGCSKYFEWDVLVLSKFSCYWFHVSFFPVNRVMPVKNIILDRSIFLQSWTCHF